MALIKIVIQSSETGPAEQFAGGSFSKSCNSFIQLQIEINNSIKFKYRWVINILTLLILLRAIVYVCVCVFVCPCRIYIFIWVDLEEREEKKRMCLVSNKYAKKKQKIYKLVEIKSAMINILVDFLKEIATNFNFFSISMFQLQIYYIG